MSLFAAVAAHNIKIPAEKNLAVHLFWLKQLLNRGIISQLQWVDTRDMNAEGHTNGSIDRTALLQLMLGVFSYAHATKLYPP